MSEPLETPYLMEGGLSVDDRGSVTYVNDFHFKGVNRFYMITNHQSGFVRAWHAHRHEAKYILAVQGSALVGAVPIDHWSSPSRETDVHRFVLSADKPSILYIPAGYANGIMSLNQEMNLIVFSTSTLEESKKDDVRFDARYWDIWKVVER